MGQVYLPFRSTNKNAPEPHPADDGELDGAEKFGGFGSAGLGWTGLAWLVMPCPAAPAA